MSPADVEELKSNIEKLEWERGYYETMKARVDDAMQGEVYIPPQGGLWSHYFICPGTGNSLVYDPASPHRHFCRDDGKYYEGELLDGAWRTHRHNGNVELMNSAALVYAVSGEEKYAEFARGLLVRYAKLYYRYPPHGGPAGLGRITGQSLNEAVWLISATMAFDLIADSPCMTEKDEKAIAKKLFIPAAQHIENYNFGVHNIQVWSDVAMLMAGLLSRKNHFIRNPLSDLEIQIAEGIREEGMWFETSLGYHLYAMRPFYVLAAICRNRGLEVCGNPKFRKYFTALANFVMPDMSFPSINDGSGGTLSAMAQGIVMARYAFDDESLDSLIQYLGDELKWKPGLQYMPVYYRDPGGEPERWKPPETSSHMPDTGLTILRRDGMYALLKYNKKGTGHDHFDRLGIIFHDGERELFPDLGTVPYAHPLYKSWYKRTEAHNTLMVDGMQHTLDECEPPVFYDERSFVGVTVECGGVYEGVTMRRTLALAGGALIDVMVADSEQERTYDWLLRANAGFEAGMEDAPVIDAPSPNENIEFTQRQRMEGPVSVGWPALKGSGKEAVTNLVYFTPWQESELYRGRSVGSRGDVRIPILMWRQKGRRAVFAAVTSTAPDRIEITAGGSEIEFSLDGKQILIINRAGEITSWK